jgi:PhnB protein
VSTVKAIPDAYPRVCPYLSVDGAADAIAFCTAVLGAAPRGDQMVSPDGKVGHAELAIGDSIVMVADEWPDHGIVGPLKIGGTAVTLGVYVEDVDAVFQRALDLGATVVRPLEDQFYGDRSGQFLDPWGHRWSVMSHIEDVPPDEMKRRAEAMMSG